MTRFNPTAQCVTAVVHMGRPGLYPLPAGGVGWLIETLNVAALRQVHVSDLRRECPRGMEVLEVLQQAFVNAPLYRLSIEWHDECGRWVCSEPRPQWWLDRADWERLTGPEQGDYWGLLGHPA